MKVQAGLPPGACNVVTGTGAQVGAPLVAGSKVSGVVHKHGKGEKKAIVKFRRRKHYLRQGTHRQFYTDVRITGIQA